MLKPVVIYLGLTLAATAALPQPARCSSGYQDASCVGYLANPPQVAPTCSTAAGWQTTSTAVWQGSHYSTPGCNYTAPPTCPGGTTQTGNPTWNGSSWVGLACTPPSAPPSPPSPLSAGTGMAADYSWITQVAGKTGQIVLSIGSNGTWQVVATGMAQAQMYGSPTSGTWTTDSTRTYQYNVSAVTKVGGAGAISPAAASAAWTTISPSMTLASAVVATQTQTYASGRWTFNIRQVGTTSPVETFTVQLDVENGN